MQGIIYRVAILYFEDIFLQLQNNLDFVLLLLIVVNQPQPWPMKIKTNSSKTSFRKRLIIKKRK